MLRLVAWEQLTTTEAAAVVGIPAATARTRLHRARTRMRAALEVHDPPDVDDEPDPARHSSPLFARATAPGSAAERDPGIAAGAGPGPRAFWLRPVLGPLVAT